MIRVEPPPEPPLFDERVRRRGAAWLAEHSVAMRPPALWSEVRDDLAAGFRNRCGYSAVEIRHGDGTVDHFRPISGNRDLSYEWNNYRYASPRMNSAKGDAVVLDPFEVQDGWFAIQLPSALLVITSSMPDTHRALALKTIERLRLNKSHAIKNRLAWQLRYESGKMTLDVLHEVDPLLAQAVEAQARRSK